MGRPINTTGIFIRKATVKRRGTIDQGNGYTLGRSAVGYQLAQHGAETQYDGQESQGVSHAFLDGGTDRKRIHAAGQPDKNGDQDKGNECIQFYDGRKKDKEHDPDK